MRIEDDMAIRELLSRSSVTVTGVTICSPSNEEFAIARAFWPAAEIRRFTQAEWNLDDIGPLPPEDWGLLMACNTFMCSRDPMLWIENIRRTHRYLLIQDLSNAQRQPHRHLSPETGDVARYSVLSHGIVGKTDLGHNVYDISSTYGVRVLDCLGYDFDHGRGSKFVVLLDLRP
jgi:hypothetical protein